ncbi:MAG: tetratricopeptide repeat protein [Gemmataceae bacterium]|nr:tetratricopeptide repeat protein [Gemmataceae bacterium]
MLNDIADLIDVAVWGNTLLSESLPGLSLSTGDPPELIQAFDIACGRLETNPDDVDARFMRGVVCQSKRWYEPALADFSAVLRKQPRHARAWLLVGEVLTALGEYDKAKVARQTALEIHPGVG